MRKEVERCRLAFETAAEGKQVAMICSGDARVYGMAGLIFEIGKEYPEIQIEVVPGITAASGGAAVLGAPLMHDFAVISLSDLLTPWETIEKRLHAAGMADFVICLYNPSSRKRHDYLQKACDPVTGLCAEYAEFDGTPHLRTQAEIEGGNPYRHDWFYSDAYRTAGNVSLDARWFGADAWKESELAAYQKFFLEHEPVFGIYEKDGRVIEGHALHPVGLLATIAECSLVTIHSGDEITASNGRFWLEKFWNTPLRKGDRRYYDNFLYLFAFLALSGEYRIY